VAKKKSTVGEARHEPNPDYRLHIAKAKIANRIRYLRKVRSDLGEILLRTWSASVSDRKLAQRDITNEHTGSKGFSEGSKKGFLGSGAAKDRVDLLVERGWIVRDKVDTTIFLYLTAEAERTIQARLEKGRSRGRAVFPISDLTKKKPGKEIGLIGAKR